MQQVYNCIIVDDEEVDRLTVTHFAKQYPLLNVMGSFGTAEEALQFAQKVAPDVLFLDIDMPGLNGLQLRKELAGIPACIFITSYPDYAVESFELEALDFIVKPLKAERFAKTMVRLQTYLDIRRKAALLDYSLGGDTLFIKDGHHQVKLQLHDIIYLEALRDYTSIVTATKKYCILSTLGNLLEQKAFQMFIRIHRSYAVQKHFINKITPKEIFVHDIILPVGRTYKNALEGLFN
ncbi:LytR/AlgR family response regulator transcription factor [Ferruginibacter profundus]